jgi:predicted nucleic acid-binding protein
MKRYVILDTGPLVALLNPSDAYHAWVAMQVADIVPPLLTCEAVLTESCFLAEKYGNNAYTVLELMQDGFMRIAFRLPEEADQITQLMRKYADVPMSLADACLVRMAELYSKSYVLTLDSDFRIYRKHGRQAIPCLTPDNM